MRFLLLAYPLLVLLLAAFGFVADQLQPTPGGLWPATTPVAGSAVVAAWCLEALALLALYLLLEGRFRTRLAAGLATAWIAWVFRGPLLVMTVVAAGEPRLPWFRLNLAWWVLYTVAGITLAALAPGQDSAAQEIDAGSERVEASPVPSFDREAPRLSEPAGRVENDVPSADGEEDRVEEGEASPPGVEPRDSTDSVAT